MDPLLVDDARALRLWQDEVEEEEKANVAVEGDPGTRSVSARLMSGGCETHQARMKDSQDSARRQQLKTTQYMSHGVSWAGSDVLRALYEAKMGKRNEVTELQKAQGQQADSLRPTREVTTLRGGCTELTREGWRRGRTWPRRRSRPSPSAKKTGERG